MERRLEKWDQRPQHHNGPFSYSHTSTSSTHNQNSFLLGWHAGNENGNNAGLILIEISILTDGVLVFLFEFAPLELELRELRVQYVYLLISPKFRKVIKFHITFKRYFLTVIIL